MQSFHNDVKRDTTPKTSCQQSHKHGYQRKMANMSRWQQSGTPTRLYTYNANHRDTAVKGLQW